MTRLSPEVPTFPENRPIACRFLPGDILALLVLGALVVLFYKPECDVLRSSYVMHAHVFERAARLVNPSYTDYLKLEESESKMPLPSLLARGWVALSRPNVARAVFAHHMTVVAVAFVATYAACRLFFPPLGAAGLTALLLFGRVIMPIARGGGITSVLLLIPSLLFLLKAMEVAQSRKRPSARRWFAAGVMAICLAVVRGLGGHEWIFGLAFLVELLALLGLEWVVRRLLLRESPPRPSVPVVVGFLAGGVLAVALLLGARAAVAPEQGRSSVIETLSGGYIGKRMPEKMVEERGLRKGHRLRIWRGTFLEGRYLTLEPGQFYNRIDEYTFLYPGRGFNGIIPLFVLPGFAIGGLLLLGRLFRHAKSLRRGGSGLEGMGRLLAFSHVVLLSQFVLLLYLSATPKPSRFTLVIFPVLCLAVEGYLWLFRQVRSRASQVWRSRRGAKARRAGRCVALVGVLAPLLVLATLRLGKNYRDLQDYFDEYAYLISNKAMAPVFFLAEHAFRDRPVLVAYLWARNPALGLLTGFRRPDNMRMVVWLDDARPVPKGAVCFVWRDRGRRDSFFDVVSGADLAPGVRKSDRDDASVICYTGDAAGGGERVALVPCAAAKDGMR